MFLSKNDASSVRSYFEKELPDFSPSELKSMWKQLMRKRFNWSDADFILNKNTLFSESDLLFFRNAVKRLQNNEPFQHIIGEVEFYGINLKIDERALIPRPETEELVDWILSDLSTNKEYKIIDLCSGSGCIALALKSILQKSEIYALEWSKPAKHLINENIQKTNLPIHLIEFDVLNADSYLRLDENGYDVWVSNPPYIPFEDKKKMKENVLLFEPEMALFVEDESPFIFYEMIADKAKRYLKENGCLYFEIHEKYSGEIEKILRKKDFVNIEVRKDLQGRDRMIKAQKVSSQNGC